jgi:hypothetical protein
MEELFRMTDNQRASRPDASTLKMEEERLQQLIAKQLAQRSSKTTQLEHEEKNRLPLGLTNPYGLGDDTTSRFVTLPASAANSNGPRWLVELVGFGGRSAPIGVEIAGDVILGVPRPGFEPPDFDLTPYRADEKGVSRRHAVIRPSRNRLYLIDLQSTNGTRVNAIPVGSGVAMELRSQDTVSLGALTFTIRIIASPTEIEKAQAARLAK